MKKITGYLSKNGKFFQNENDCIIEDEIERKLFISTELYKYLILSDKSESYKYNSESIDFSCSYLVRRLLLDLRKYESRNTIIDLIRCILFDDHKKFKNLLMNIDDKWNQKEYTEDYEKHLNNLKKSKMGDHET